MMTHRIMFVTSGELKESTNDPYEEDRLIEEQLNSLDDEYKSSSLHRNYSDDDNKT